MISLQVLPHYPMIIGIGQALERRVDRVHKEERDKRPDLYALALGYSGLLKQRKAHWLAEQHFHYCPPVSKKRTAYYAVMGTLTGCPYVFSRPGQTFSAVFCDQ